MNLMFEYVENEDLATTMTEIVTEELEHFHMVRKLLRNEVFVLSRSSPALMAES